MTTLRIDLLKEGLEVSEDAKNGSGMIIAPKGTILTEKHLRAFKAWGIFEVQIKDGELQDSPMLAWDHLDMETKNDISHTVERLYSENDQNDSVVMEFEKITISMLVKKHSRQVNSRSLKKVG